MQTMIAAAARALPRNVSPGRVLNPAELAAECTSLTKKPSYEAYAIATVLSDVVVRRLESRLLPRAVGFGVYSSPKKMMLGIATLQSAGLQLRAILPFCNQKAVAWLEDSIARRALTFAMDVAEVNQLAVVSAGYSFPADEEVRRLVSSSRTVDAQCTFDALTDIAQAMLDPAALPSCIPEYRVSNVHVVVAAEFLTSDFGPKGAMPWAMALH